MAILEDISRLAATYAGYRKRVEVCGYPPTRVWVEVTSDCNLHCSFCCNRELAGDQRGYMSLDLFQSLADECAGKVRQVNLFHRGEPLLHEQIGYMVRYATGRGLRTRINTNGVLLDRALGLDLIESGLDILSFSFDGYDREMYETNRPGAGFDRVIGNILGFLRLKRETGASKPYTALELMEISDDPPPVLAEKRRVFLRQFEGLPLDKFVIRRPHNWAGQVSMGTGSDSARRIPCPLLWHALVVFWDGRVLPCPQDFFGRLQLGTLGDERLMDLWNGGAIRSLRRQMADIRHLTRAPCTECDRIVRPTVAGVPVDYLGRFLSESVFGNTWLSRILPH